MPKFQSRQPKAHPNSQQWQNNKPNAKLEALLLEYPNSIITIDPQDRFGPTDWRVKPKNQQLLDRLCDLIDNEVSAGFSNSDNIAKTLADRIYTLMEEEGLV